MQNQGLSCTRHVSNTCPCGLSPRGNREARGLNVTVTSEQAAADAPHLQVSVEFREATRYVDAMPDMNLGASTNRNRPDRECAGAVLSPSLFWANLAGRRWASHLEVGEG